MSKKLKPADYEKMWGEEGPYSQVRLCEEIRILDDSVSRVFLVVEAEINPFTFGYVEKHREKFEGDEAVLQLLDHAEDRGKFGYVVGAGEVEVGDEDAKQFAREQAEMTTQTLIRMHKFVIDEFGLKKSDEYGIIKDKRARRENLVWNEKSGRAEPVESELWGSRTFVGSPSGVKNNKMRFFFVLAFEKGFDYKKESVIHFAKTLSSTAEGFKVEVEDAESFMEYVLVTALVPLEVAPGNFIEAVIDGCKRPKKKSIFAEDYFVSNVKKPTQKEIMAFLKSLPL